MKSNLTELRSEYLAATDKARGMVARAKKEGRDFTGDENAAFSALQTRMRELETSIENRAIVHGMEAGAMFAEIVRTEPDNPHASGALQRAQAQQANRYIAESLREMIKTGVSHVSDLREMRSILSSNSTGTISEVVQDQTFTALLAANMPLARHGMILDDNSENYQKFPYQSGTLEPGLVGEASAIGASSLTIGSHNVSLDKFAVIQKFSLEVMEDYPPILQHIAQAGAQGFSNRLTRYAFDSAAGTSGINTIEASGYNASGFNWHNVIDGVSTLQAANVNEARLALCVAPQTWGVLAKLLGAGDGQYLRRPQVLENLPVEQTTGITASEGSTTAFLADWSSCRMIVRGIGAQIIGGGSRFQADPYTTVVSPGMMPINDLYLGSGELGVLLYLRADFIVHRPDNILIWENLPYPT